jgi:hypothetical protein
VSAVLDAAHQLVQAYPGGAESLGPRIGKNPTTLRHEVNRTGAAKLGLVDAVSMSVMSGDLRVLNTFAAECGCLVVPLPSTANGDFTSMEHISRLAQEFAEMVASVSATKADGKVTANELAQVEREGAGLVQACQVLMAHLRSLYEAGIPPSSTAGDAP